MLLSSSPVKVYKNKQYLQLIVTLQIVLVTGKGGEATIRRPAADIKMETEGQVRRSSFPLLVISSLGSAFLPYNACQKHTRIVFYIISLSFHSLSHFLSPPPFSPFEALTSNALARPLACSQARRNHHMYHPSTPKEKV